MPEEKEIKIIIHPGVTEDDIANLPGFLYKGAKHIRQYYLPDGTRIRSTTTASSEPVQEFFFTYKRKILSSVHRIEIETKISEDDFYLLAKDASRTILKTRHYYEHRDTGLTVEFDMFRHMTSNNLPLSLIHI